MTTGAGVARRVTRAGLATAFTNLGLATLNALFLAAHLRVFAHSPRPSVLLVCVTETLFAAFFLLRRDASAVSLSATAWLSTIAGTYLPLLLRPVDGAHDVAAAQVVQTLGTAFSVYGVASLNRCVGLLPANRGIRTGGAYRWVRHPLYASYTLANCAYLASNPSVANALICAAALAAQVLRIFQEERLLLRDPDYASYAARARWRMLPFVF